MKGPAATGRSASLLIVLVALLVDLLLWGGTTQVAQDASVPLVVVPLVTVTTYGLLLFRWRRPIAVFAGLFMYSLAALVMPAYAPIAGILVALHAVAARSRLLTASVALAMCTIPFGVDCYRGAQNRVHVETSPIASFVAQFSLYGVLTMTVWGLGRLARAAELRSERLQRERAADAVVAERLRVARELHDIIGDAVTAMHMTAAGARTLLGRDDARVRESLDVITSTGVLAMNELHRMLRLLRSVESGDAALPGPTAPVMSSSLDDAVTVARAAGIHVDSIVSGAPADLDRSVDRAAYCVVLEALTNSVKHAGRGSWARVSVTWTDAFLDLSVRDGGGQNSGKGEPSSMSGGFGLLGLAERVDLAGGHLTAAERDGGFLVQARFPITRRERPLAAAIPPGPR